MKYWRAEVSEEFLMFSELLYCCFSVVTAAKLEEGDAHCPPYQPIPGAK